MPQNHHFAFPPAPRSSLPIVGSDQLFPVRRISCIGQNYALHALEMGSDPKVNKPFLFSKPGEAVEQNGVTLPFPPDTNELHHEIELVIAISKAGRDIAPEQALDHVFGYAVGIDLTRRDVQLAAKKAGRPWDAAKGFDRSAPITAITPAATIATPNNNRIWLAVNGEIRQDSDTSDMILGIPQLISFASSVWQLMPGDLIFSGTPSGVGPLHPGDTVTGGVAGLSEIQIKLEL